MDHDAGPSLSSKAVAAAIRVFEQPWMPDALTRLAIRGLVARTRWSLRGVDPAITPAFARAMKTLPIAEHTDAANAQHYEVPAEFFALVLGPQRKYSCCLYGEDTTSLADAEEAALAQTAAHAGLADGQSILELGCGWGSLSLWMARRFPGARITAVSNSASQKASIDARARGFGVRNLTVVTADANTFEADKRYDRIVSVEMFEHMSNWHALLGRLRRWVEDDGRVFLHVFAHRSVPYRFDHTDPADWIGQHFFTGGIMPSERLIDEFPSLFAREATWRWSGTHYQRTADDWLANFDRNSEAILEIFRACYGRDAALWLRRWRLFFLATSGLFGHARGEEWGVIHSLLRPAVSAAQPPTDRAIAGATR
jgi:cyclopropane-fatty-acyl-phospholipid synthase